MWTVWIEIVERFSVLGVTVDQRFVTVGKYQLRPERDEIVA
jgi:hypothetical protein